MDLICLGYLALKFLVRRVSHVPVLLQLIGGIIGSIAVVARVPHPFVELFLVSLEGPFLSELLVAEVALVIGVRTAGQMTLLASFCPARVL